MVGIGSLIKALRIEKGMSVAETCNGICTERFMYMVENNNRIPSADIIKQIGQRLDINIYDFMDFIGFKSPILLKSLIDLSAKLKISREYNKLIEVNNKLMSMDNSTKEPVCYEILSNQIFLNLFYDKQNGNAFEMIEKGLLKIHNVDIEKMIATDCFINNYYYIIFINYLFIFHRINGENTKARMILDYLWKMIAKYKNEQIYQNISISVSINYLYDYVFIYKNKDIIKDIEDFLEYQIQLNKLDRIYYTYYFMSGYYYNTNDMIKARDYFKMMIFAGISLGNPDQYCELFTSIHSNYIYELFPEKSFTIDF